MIYVRGGGYCLQLFVLVTNKKAIENFEVEVDVQITILKFEKSIVLVFIL